MPNVTKLKFGPEYRYHTYNFGDFYVIGPSGFSDSRGQLYYRIKFFDTGGEIDVRGSRIPSGQIKDPYRPIIFGVACHGVVPNDIMTKFAYKIWYNIIRRIFDPTDSSYYIYGAKGVSISRSWLCFENFLKDLPYLPGYELWLQDHTKYKLDKDKLQFHLPYNQRVYSKETCCFISVSENRVFTSQSLNCSSPYNGVSWDPNRNSYTAKIKINGICNNLGRFDNEEAAAVVFNHFAAQYGRCLNENVNMSYLDALEYKHGGNRFPLYTVKREEIIDP